MIYLDNNGTTQPLSEVVAAMLPFLHDEYANPSSVHRFGQQIRHRVECAREQVAKLIHAAAKDIIFTSGGTEAINLAIRGGLAARPGKNRLLTTAVEHSAVLRVMEDLSASGFAVDVVGVDSEGRVDFTEWLAKLTDETALASVMQANNETGVLFDVARLAEAAAQRGVPLHVDAVQAAGKVEMDVRAIPADFISLSAHKFHGPKGVGALFVRRRSRLHAQIAGGSQERDLRGGTENVPGIIGMGVAADHAAAHLAEAVTKVGVLRDRLESGIQRLFPDVSINGGASLRIANTTNISFPGLEAEAILIVLSEAGICASSGSACSSGSLEPSHVLKAMGIPDTVAHGAIRFSLSRNNTANEIEEVVVKLPELLKPLQALVRR